MGLFEVQSTGKTPRPPFKAKWWAQAGSTCRFLPLSIKIHPWLRYLFGYTHWFVPMVQYNFMRYWELLVIFLAYIVRLNNEQWTQYRENDEFWEVITKKNLIFMVIWSWKNRWHNMNFDTSHGSIIHRFWCTESFMKAIMSIKTLGRPVLEIACQFLSGVAMTDDLW